MGGLTPERIGRLLELQRQKRELLREFHELTLQQERLIELEETAVLKENLNQRQELITEIDTLHQELNLLMQTYSEYSQQAGADPAAQEIGALQQESQKLLQEIAALDEQNQARTARQIDRFRDEVKRLSLGRRTIQSYNQSISALGSELFDKKT